jgi:hypothetical protein
VISYAAVAYAIHPEYLGGNDADLAVHIVLPRRPPLLRNVVLLALRVDARGEKHVLACTRGHPRTRPSRARSGTVYP